MNKQIISLICIAVFLAFGLVMANEKWPDGYRTAPTSMGETTAVGAVVKGPVVLPEAKNDTPKQAPDTSITNDASTAQGKIDATVQDTTISPKSEEKPQAPQGELVAIDSGTLKQEAPKTEAKEQASASKKESQAVQAKAPAKSEAKPAEKASETGLQGTATPRIRLDGQEAILEITASAPIRCKTFKLSDPNRLVVDLIGTWTVPSPSVPSNLIIQRVRVGDAAERTRIVLDLKKALKADTIKQVDASTIHIHLR